MSFHDEEFDRIARTAAAKRTPGWCAACERTATETCPACGDDNEPEGPMTSMNIIPRDAATEQRRTALELANETRISRATLKRDIKAGRVGAASILREPPEYAQAMRVFDVVTSVSMFGRQKANRVMRAEHLSAGYLVGELTPRQVEALIAALPRKR